MERGCVGNCLHLIARVEAWVLNRNARPIHDVDHLPEAVAEVRIARTAVAQIPTGIHVEVHQVGQSPGVYRSYRTACERAEWLQIHRLPVHFSQKRVEKILMTELVVGILGDVGWHVLVNRFQSLPIGAIKVGKFGVLLPEIRFQYLCRRQESQDGRISICNGSEPIPIVAPIRKDTVNWKQ